MIIKRYDIPKKDLKLYPQYYQFKECSNGRWVKFEDVEELLKENSKLKGQKNE
jgi:hypothetical protein